MTGACCKTCDLAGVIGPRGNAVPATGPEVKRQAGRSSCLRITKETPLIVMVNPFAGLELPVIRPHEIDLLERDETEALYAAAAEFGVRWRTLIWLSPPAIMSTSSSWRMLQ